MRCSSSSTSSTNTGGGDNSPNTQEEARKTSTAGADVATRDDARAEEEFVGREDDPDRGNLNTSPAGVLEMGQPLVERVASALEQRCSVRGGDLVRVFPSVCDCLKRRRNPWSLLVFQHRVLSGTL